ncbi:bifunctional adenosylcobinamide kinase/adenosylcobinamide-phosphate guanylyltransferase [Rhodoligotrophos defluvii]|uniref:bifunctional adenosylcobinamide kinase/adenosylcobinamide-phosphate guanylyltransferase n=1 Tax=Rhodoligotrophos defluvii TaxID=2561934 RepID=UPI0010C98D24|nr:bifunctional adenosylcobinamide kinase/adenosylcobinamide-phosphate guanylyltransferase [Rhodoligotrophos defluvii]
METALPKLTLVLGGARSGKSRHAEQLVTSTPPPWAYVATARAYDDEMRARIAQHRQRRASGWQTIEAPVDLGGAIRQLLSEQPVLIDCLTLWLTNLMLGEHDRQAALRDLEAALDARSGPVVMVSNEVGLGIVPENALARSFRDAQGRLNQHMAGRADAVLFMVAGLPLKVK